MTSKYPPTEYYVLAHWPRRHEQVEALAGRLLKYVDALSRLEGRSLRWSVGKTFTPYESVRGDLASLVERDVMRSDDGEIERISGYTVIGVSENLRQPFGFGGTVGATVAMPMANRIDFDTLGIAEPDLSIVTYGLMKAAMLAVISCWQPSICFARCSDLKPDWDNEGRFAKAWITYVPPAYVHDVDLSRIAIVDMIPDGGLLLSATRDLFRADNPAHIAAADAISRATRHLNTAIPDL